MEERRGDRFVVVGQVLAPLGVRGHMRVRVLSDVPGRFSPGAFLYVEGRRYRVREVKRLKPDLIALALEGITTPEQARWLRGRFLEVPLDSPRPRREGVYYHFELIGMRVLTPDGRRLGTLEEIISTPAHDVYVVRDERGREVLIPAVDSVVKRVDVEGGEMTVEPPPGLLPDEGN